ncbi:ABC transporter permease [Brenneria corticis]|uniref:ABC transporter permease n=1 Tax=Brenneria corticis TaxID=2173106 RepID=A0A2U1TVD9_9GAMM|nr:ABC transporter permease [Brenneria sp. CFCC 11842]PWC13371.1 ABC transporter permease [Brenneria sp. CFCC 11842]
MTNKRRANTFGSGLLYQFTSSPLIVCAALTAALLMVCSLLAPFIAPHDPFNPQTIDLMDSLLPPVWHQDGEWRFPLGTDDQGRDLLSAILYGTRTSVAVGFIAVAIAAILGVTLGLIAGYAGGFTDAVIMRVVDVQMTFPAILVALLADGITRGLLPREEHDSLALFVIILSLALSIWPQVARTVRASTMVEKNREYVQAVRIIGRPAGAILFKHIMPNVLGPVLVIATINLGSAILGEATLSFLGVGMPATEPSLGTLIRIGNSFLFSGERWIVMFPGLVLALLVMSVNLLGDRLRDALDPKLR